MELKERKVYHKNGYMYLHYFVDENLMLNGLAKQYNIKGNLKTISVMKNDATYGVVFVLKKKLCIIKNLYTTKNGILHGLDITFKKYERKYRKRNKRTAVIN